MHPRYAISIPSAFPDLRPMAEAVYRPVSWGYVPRGEGEGRELLVAERFKKADPLRAGELVIPGGGMKEIAARHRYGLFAHAFTARREVLEETGVNIPPESGTHQRTEVIGNLAAAPLLKARPVGSPKVDAIISPDEWVYVFYRDSGKAYAGKLVRFAGYLLNEPVNQQDADARNPRYLQLAEALRRRGEFTPACQVLLEMIEAAEGLQPLERDGDIVLEGNAEEFSIAPPE
ncbi:MAG: NUDIX domain-containing protein [Candidatus Aenigmarchaeota archaeon]|nr:NUDIX domain-containing protein [Candidatus Aenigmarchaeota archaeon]